jgi:hypothetical protein
MRINIFNTSQAKVLVGLSCPWDPNFMFCLSLHFIFGKCYLDTSQREHHSGNDWNQKVVFQRSDGGASSHQILVGQSRQFFPSSIFHWLLNLGPVMLDPCDRRSDIPHGRVPGPISDSSTALREPGLLPGPYVPQCGDALYLSRTCTWLF